MVVFTRTANAGGLLEMDGVRILLDGVSEAVGEYLATPPEMADRLLEMPLDLLAFTHSHSDHFSPDFVRRYARFHQPLQIAGPTDVASKLPEYPVITGSAAIGPVQIAAVPSRHMGAAYQRTPHNSFLLKGSAVVWFLGDASPLQWKGQECPPDVLIAPYAYASTETAWRITEQFAPERLVLLHLPDRNRDSAGLRSAVQRVLDSHPFPAIVPDLGQRCEIIQ